MRYFRIFVLGSNVAQNARLCVSRETMDFLNSICGSSKANVVSIKNCFIFNRCTIQMITTSEQFDFSIQQLDKLRQRAQTVEADSAKDILFKEMELAGVRGMITQIEKEVRSYNLARLQETLKELQIRSRSTPPEQIPELFGKMLGAMTEFTTAMQPVI